MLPEVFVLGAAKSGTTTLAKWMAQYGDAYIPDEKEVHFFSNDKRYSNGRHFYESFYNSKNGRVAIDATPEYFHLPDKVIPRLFEVYDKETLSNLKFIVILRDPSDRAYSHYKHRCRLLKESRSFREVVSDKEVYKEWKNYVHDGFYAKQLEKWWDNFDKNQFLILITDDLKSDPEKTVNLISDFLGLGKRAINTSIEANVASKPKNKNVMEFLTKPGFLKKIVKVFISEKTRKRVIERLISLNLEPDTKTDRLARDDRAELVGIYRDDIDRLSKLINRDLSKWKNL
jgi:hypothetical protein